MSANGTLQPPARAVDPDVAALRAEIRSLREDVALLRAQSGRKTDMRNVDAVADALANSGFDRTDVITAKDGDPGQYLDRSTVMVCPTRGMIEASVVEAWQSMSHPMNQRRVGPIFARGFEVGAAYNVLVQQILQHEVLRTWSYVMTMEDDNIPPLDAHMRLLDAIERGRTADGKRYDAISGLYFTKDAAHLPMAYGDPAEFRRTGRTDYRPLGLDKLDVPNDERGNPGIVEVLGIPMGCTIWRMELFRQVPPPWFVTLSEEVLVDGKLVRVSDLTEETAGRARRCMTQDMYFCERAVRQGKRFGILPSVRVGHLDVNEGIVY